MERTVLRSQDEILNQFESTSPGEVTVSVCCASYNHEKYIEELIRGVLNQITKFSFELIIYDDGSTDNTQNIISNYFDKYPRIITPILSKQNNYNTVKATISRNTFNIAKGRYLMILDGDDFWHEPSKIERQIALFENHPETDICFQPARTLKADGTLGLIGWHGDSVKIIDFCSVVVGGGGKMPTASICLRANCIDNLFFSLVESSPAEDLALQIWGAKRGGALYSPFVASTYRLFVEGSWTRLALSSPERLVLSYRKQLKYIDKLVENKVISFACFCLAKTVFHVKLALRKVLSHTFQTPMRGL